MTTIAFDGRYLAADGRMTRGGIICSETVKKTFLLTTVLRGVTQEIIAFGAGNWNGISAQVEWMKANDVFDLNPDLPRPIFPGDPDGENQDTNFITKDGQVWALDGLSRPVAYPTPFAEGSGFPFAQMALNMGMSAVEAVRQAIKMDCGSGGQITVFDVEEWKFVDPNEF